MNIAEKLKDCPKGMELYSPIIGYCQFFDILDSAGEKVVRVYKEDSMIFYQFRSNGTYRLPGNEVDGECMLFVDDNCDASDWAEFNYKKPCPFKPFDKVVMRHDETDKWRAALFSHYSFDEDDASTPYYMVSEYSGGWGCCLPYNEETAKLIGTRLDYKEN